MTSLELKVPKRVALANTVADRIAWAIATGRLSPGERISEVGLAEQTGVSRAPIREALKILQSQGIVAGEQNRGYRVAPVNGRIAQQILEMRLFLESVLLRDAVLNLRAAGKLTTGFDEPLAAMRKAASEGDRVASLAADLAFHRAIALAADNHIAFTLWEAIARHVLILFSRHEYRDEDLNAVVAQHEAFRAFIDDMILSNRDANAVTQGLEDHLLQVARSRTPPG